MGDEAGYDPLALCSQDPYPGDQQILDMERATVLMNGLNNVPIIEERTKDTAKALQEFSVARCLKDEGKYEEALLHCTVALSYDNQKPGYWQLRSELHKTLGLLSEAYRDCLMARRDNNVPEIWVLGGSILHDLDLPVLAEAWFRKATQMSKGACRAAKLMFQQIRCERLYDPITYNLPVKVVFSEYGRAIKVSEALGKGDIAFREQPLVAAQTLTTIDAPACSHCAKSLITAIDYFGNETLLNMPSAHRKIIAKYWPEVSIIKCPKCGEEKYCSEECLLDAWDSYHQCLCPGVNPPAAELYNFISRSEFIKDRFWSAIFSPMALAKIWANILITVKRLSTEEGVPPTVEHWARAKSPYRKFIAYGNFGHAQWADKMVELMNKIFDNWEGITYTIDQREFDGRYYQVACNCQSFADSESPYYRFINRLKVDIKNAAVLEYLHGPPAEAIFGGLFPLQACANHSCENNIEVMDAPVNGKPGIALRTRRNIRVGEELFSTYIDTQLVKLERRSWLFRAYNFWCQCERCKFEGEDAKVCTHCGAKNAEGKNFPACSQCKRAYYCSTNCQKSSWKQGHKRICKSKHSNIYADPTTKSQIDKLSAIMADLKTNS